VEKVRILLADDEERIRDIIREYTNLEGYELVEAGMQFIWQDQREAGRCP
jgi:CheY-like chemotaxis protein